MLGVVAMYQLSVFALLAGIVVLGLLGFAALSVIMAIARSENLTELLKALVLGGLGVLALCVVTAMFWLSASYDSRESATVVTAPIEEAAIVPGNDRGRMTTETDVKTQPAPARATGRSEATADLEATADSEDAASDSEALPVVTKRAELPDWVNDDHYVGDVHYVSVSSFPKVDVDDARSDAWELAQEQIVEDFHAHYPDAADWDPPGDLLPRESVVIEEFCETRDMNITGNFRSPMQVVHYRVQLTPETREIVHRAYRELVVRERVERIGIGLGVLTVLTGGMALFLRRPRRHPRAAA